MKIRPLPVLGLLFILSMVSRTAALSSEVKTSTAAAVPAAETPVQSPPQCLTGDVLLAANNRLVELDRREAWMQDRESAYTAITARTQEQLTAVNLAKASLYESTAQRSELAQEDLIHLTQMYESMKPKQAAKIFEEMDVNFAAGFIRQMKSAHAGLILSNMSSKKAYQISLIIASAGAEYR